MSEFPTYNELPLIEKLGIRTSWEVFSNHLGTLNFITQDVVRKASSQIRTGRVFGLSIESDLVDPPLYDRPALQHEVFETTRNIFEDQLDHFNPQAGSQWDGLGHIQAREFGFYGGLTDESQVRERLGIHHLAAHGIVGRGVLVDVADYYGSDWDPLEENVVGPQEIATILEEQGTELQEGDILCLRFGWVSAYRGKKARGEDLSNVGITFAGISAADELVEYLWDSRVAAVGADNPGVENSPGSREVGSLHRKLIPGLGYPLAEMLDLDALAEFCKAHGRYTFLFTSAPLPLRGGVSSTANALAIL